tara:strand:- start:287 stop:772 length:486 start_codon:yes stop_codon:yes gene_type:complete
MKKLNLNLILLLFITIIFSSCQQEETPEQPDFISSDINLEEWEAVPYIRYRDNDTIILGGFSEDQDLTKGLAFKIKFEGEGEYTLNKFTHYITLFQGDIETSLYRFDENSASQFTITEYNSEQNFIKGNFEMSLLLESGDPENLEDKLVFKNGSFKATLDE